MSRFYWWMYLGHVCLYIYTQTHLRLCHVHRCIRIHFNEVTLAFPIPVEQLRVYSSQLPLHIYRSLQTLSNLAPFIPPYLHICSKQLISQPLPHPPALLTPVPTPHCSGLQGDNDPSHDPPPRHRHGSSGVGYTPATHPHNCTLWGFQPVPRRL